MSKATELPAGPELDAAVAERVMGMWRGPWRGEPDHWWQRHYDGRDRMHGGVGLPGGSVHPNSLPKFSTDIAAAWEVHRRACSWLFSRRGVYLAALAEESRLPSGDLPHGLHALVVLTDRMPEAICRAALAALPEMDAGPP